MGDEATEAVEQSLSDAAAAAAEANKEPGEGTPAEPAKKPDPKPDPAKDPPVAAKPVKPGPAFAEIARQGRQLQAEKEAFKATQAAAEAIAAKYKPLEEVLSKGDVKGLMALVEANGITFRKIVEAMSGEEPAPTAEEIAARVVTEELAKRKKEETEAAAKDLDARYGAAAARRKDEFRALIKADGDKYEQIAIEGEEAMAEEAWILTEQMHEQTGRAMSASEALDLIEAKLVEKEKKRLGSKKVAALFREMHGLPPQAATKSNGRAATPTLNNRNSSGVPAVATDDDDSVLDSHAAIERAARRAGIQL